MDMYAISNPGLVVPELSGSTRELVLQERDSSRGVIRFWNELKRRKVIRVVTVYAASAYIILEFEDIVGDDLGLPDWTGLVLIILLSIGLVITAVLSWIYDITPEGIRKTEDDNGGLPTFVRRNSRGAWQNSETEPGQRSWFRRHRVFRRYLLPLAVFAVLFLLIRFWEPIFNNPKKMREQAMIHATNAGIYFNSSTDLQAVKTELDLALSFDSGCASAQNTYGMVCLAEGDTALAKHHFHQAIQSDSGFASAWSNLASVAFWEDDYNLALDYTFHAVESDPNNALAAYNMAIQSWDRGLKIQAVEWFRKAILMDSLFTQANSALGALYNELERPSEAILVLQKSLELAPSSEYNFLIYKNLAEAYYRLRQYDRALGYLGQSKSLAPEYPETEKCYARLYEATGETDMSIQHWQRYLILEQDSVQRLAARHHLDSLHLSSEK
jgi:tetratricopeptide (TPR) repeat protein